MALTQITEKGIKDGEIINADINASAAIAGSKIDPSFGNNAIISGGRLTIANVNPYITLTDTNNDSDFSIQGGGGTFVIKDDTNGADRLVVKSDGQVGMGTSSPVQQAGRGLHINGTDQTRIKLTNASSGATANDGFDIIQENGLDIHLINHESAAMKFGTNDTERIRISSAGSLLVGCTSTPSASVTGTAFITESSGRRTGFMSSSSTSEMFLFQFFNPNGGVGSIRTNGSATSFQTSSDYRLKENGVAISDGITRLKTLKPYRFNFKADADTTLDGFFAHEVQSVVPEAISGTKDEVDSDDNPVYQGIDQSKLVPLLTAALQEAITKIETLETKVAALLAV